MEVKVFQPADPILKPYIECLYTLKRDANEPPTKYAAFPSIYSMVCMNANSRIEIEDHDLSFAHDPSTPHQLSLICDFDTSGWMTYEGAMDEIVIYFKPLGINAFLEHPLKGYFSSFFTMFDPYADYQESMAEIFELKDNRKRIERLERYWRSKLKGFEHPFLQQVVDEIIRDDFRGSVSDLAMRHGVSRTTLAKHFDQYVCTTPSQFKKVARFRSAMRRHRDAVDDLNLSEISHGAEYFDQSHMIKDFKSLTRLSPKTFFSKLSTLEDGHINWLFDQPA